MTKRSESLNLRVPPDLKAAVHARADTLHLTVNELVNRSLAWLVEQPIRSTQTTERF